jgi:hypothetical protein
MRSEAAACAATLEGWKEVTQGAGGGRANLRTADSILSIGALHWLRAVPLALQIARLYERSGEAEAGLRLVKHRGRRGEELVQYLSPALLMQARLAARLGRRDEAITAYDRYLTLMAAPEPELEVHVADVRRELAALVGEGR